MRTRWVMRGLEGRDTWETAHKYSPEELNVFVCARPVCPIWNDPLINPQPGDMGSTGEGRRICGNPVQRET